MKWTFAVTAVCGFVLAMALAFGGHAMSGPHFTKPDPCVCCGEGGPLPWRSQKQVPEGGGISPPAVLPIPNLHQED